MTARTYETHRNTSPSSLSGKGIEVLEVSSGSKGTRRRFVLIPQIHAHISLMKDNNIRR
jgi:hypothetical protein